MPSASAWYGSAPKSNSVSTVLKVVWFSIGITAIISGVCGPEQQQQPSGGELPAGLGANRLEQSSLGVHKQMKLNRQVLVV